MEEEDSPKLIGGKSRHGGGRMGPVELSVHLPVHLCVDPLTRDDKCWHGAVQWDLCQTFLASAHKKELAC